MIERAVAKLPALAGKRIRIGFQSSLTAYGGKLLSGDPEHGIAVYAGSFIRDRKMILESELLSKKADCERILIHELFHFVWARCGNRDRLSFENLLQREMQSGARGELGESAERYKYLLAKHDLPHRTRRWREYVCESFCDTAAWFFLKRPAPQCGIAKRWQHKRTKWFCVFASAPLKV